MKVRSTVTEAITAFAAQPAPDHRSAVNTAAVSTALLDTVGVAIAGQQTDTARILLEWVQSVPSIGNAAVWGTGAHVSPLDSALVNATAAHALDWDDASPSTPMHPSAVLVPALLSQATVTDFSGPVFTKAYNVGAAVFRAVSEALPAETSVERGWHNTATTGRIAAVAALASATLADPEVTARALGVAGSMSSGSVSNFGTMTKPLHAGLAARDALMALSLAARGFSANPAQLEARSGFFEMYGDGDDARLGRVAARLSYWERNWPQDWSLKRYPCCYGTHHAADAALELHGMFDPETAEHIEVVVYAGDLAILTKGRPRTGLEAKFSLEYVVAATLLRGALTLKDFESVTVNDPAVVGLMSKICVVADATEPHRCAELRIALRGGRELKSRVDVTYGDSRRPLSEADVLAKFVSACQSAGGSVEESEDAAQVLRTAVQQDSLAHLHPLLARPVAVRV
jgi:2-methylcitrate dehydratase PrpD